MRVVGSAEPPGGKPTMKRIGLDGYEEDEGCDDAASGIRTTSNPRSRRFMGGTIDARAPRVHRVALSALRMSCTLT